MSTKKDTQVEHNEHLMLDITLNKDLLISFTPDHDFEGFIF